MRIAIDCGHTLSSSDTGAEALGKREQNLTRELGNVVINKLIALGNTVIDCTIDNCSSLEESLSYRYNKANNNNVDIFISIHFNAGGGYGTEIYTYKGKKLEEAINILNDMSLLGFKNRGIKDGSSLAVIRNTNATAILVEVAFIDTVSDMALYDLLGAEAIGDVIASRINKSKLEVEEEEEEGNKDNKIKINELKRGWIVRLQEECNKQGFSSQIVDGISGENTLKGCPAIKYGAIGDITKLFQEKLVSLGYNTNGIDGVFGYGTKNAVSKFQKDNGLLVDGIAGKNTWRKIIYM